MSKLAILIVALSLAHVLLAQDDITDICDYPCAQEIFSEHCGGAVCPLPKSPDQDELAAICSTPCLNSLIYGDVAGCIADVDVWRPLIDEHILGMYSEIQTFCTSNGVKTTAVPCQEAPSLEEAYPSYGLDENDMDEIMEADLLD